MKSLNDWVTICAKVMFRRYVVSPLEIKMMESILQYLIVTHSIKDHRWNFSIGIVIANLTHVEFINRDLLNSEIMKFNHKENI